ncbi:hypothetical protein ACJZ2D_003765 [Fusarium nematophilum]
MEQPRPSEEPDTSQNDDASSVITLGLMPQQSEVLAPGDDWTGRASRATRRRLQNRLNQRAYRRRRLEDSGFSNLTGQQEEQSSTDMTQAIASGELTLLTQRRDCQLSLPEIRSRLEQFTREAYQEYMLAAPRPTALHTLTQLNVLHALGANAAALGISIASLCAEDSISPFNHQGPCGSWDSAPPGLRPTALQTAVRHHPWIDLFPVPEVRDCFIRISSGAYEDELCVDLVDAEPSDEEKPKLIVWGDPSDPRAWEATVPFLRKWGWVVRGCQGLFDATNHWRQLRGEKKLRF